MIMKKLYREDTLSSRKITHVLSPLPEVAGVTRSFMMMCGIGLVR